MDFYEENEKYDNQSIMLKIVFKYSIRDRRIIIETEKILKLISFYFDTFLKIPCVNPSRCAALKIDEWRRKVET